MREHEKGQNTWAFLMGVGLSTRGVSGTCRGLGSFSLCRLLPTAAEGFVELHDAEQLIQTNLRER